MVIKASSEKTVDRLIADLSVSEPPVRDGAIARLTVIGARAVQRLLGVAADRQADPATRSAAFRALEAIADPRALDVALDGTLHEDPDIAAAAAGVARALLRTPKGMAALDRLTTVALDRRRPTAVRVAAARALTDLDRATIGPLLAALAEDPDEAVAAVASPPGRPAAARTEPVDILLRAAEGAAVEPTDLRLAIAQETKAPATLLHQIVQRAREREGAETGEGRAAWLAVRAAAHAALAQQRSRLALYDLRETIETANAPLAVEFVAALASIGDASCLEAVAGAYGRAARGAPAREDWWRRSLADVFRAIVEREGLTGRHAVLRRVENRWPGLSRALLAHR